MKKLLIAFTLGAAMSASAQVTLSNATLWQNPMTRVVEVTYDLTGPAPVYITLGITTNNVAIPDPVTVEGDITTLLNPKVIEPDNTPGAPKKKILWAAKRDWPGELTLDARAVVTAWFTDDPPEHLLLLSKPTYIVVDLSGGPSATKYPMRASYVSPATSGASKTTELWLRRIPKGTFTMGSPVGELGRKPSVWEGDETQHDVTLTQDFYIGVFEVTQKQWELVMGNTPATHKGDTRPVETVHYSAVRGATLGANWPADNQVDANSFMGLLRDKTGLTFDLPTEAQWEYACRAGTATALNNGQDLTNITACQEMDEVGLYAGNGGGVGAHTTVGSYPPNAWGLYDMHGNVWEWCLDWFSYGMAADAVSDPRGASAPPAGTKWRITRGGSFNDDAQYCRSAVRACATNGGSTCGFRACFQP